MTVLIKIGLDLEYGSYIFIHGARPAQPAAQWVSLPCHVRPWLRCRSGLINAISVAVTYTQGGKLIPHSWSHTINFSLFPRRPSGFEPAAHNWLYSLHKFLELSTAFAMDCFSSVQNKSINKWTEPAGNWNFCLQAILHFNNSSSQFA